MLAGWEACGRPAAGGSLPGARDAPPRPPRPLLCRPGGREWEGKAKKCRLWSKCHRTAPATKERGGGGREGGGVEDAGLKAKCLSPSHVGAALQSSLHNAIQPSLLRERHDVRTRHKKSPGDQEGEGSDWWLPVHFGAALPEGAQRGVRRPGGDSSRLDKTTWLHAKKTCFLCFLAFPCFTRYNSI